MQIKDTPKYHVAVAQSWYKNSVSLKKGNPDLISNLWKTKHNNKESENKYQGMIVPLFFFHMTHWSCILDNRWLLSNHFCKTCQNYFFFKVLSHALAWLSCVKGNPGLTPNFSKFEVKKYNKTWFLVHDSIISLL